MLPIVGGLVLTKIETIGPKIWETAIKKHQKTKIGSFDKTDFVSNNARFHVILFLYWAWKFDLFFTIKQYEFIKGESLKL